MLRPAALLPAAAFLFLAAGAAVRVAAGPAAGAAVWFGGLVIAGLPLVGRTVVGLFRGRFAADLVAALAIVTALILWQPLPGLVVALMQSGGEALERLAARRASRAVRDLEAQAPRVAHRLHAEHQEDIPVAAIAIGDRLVVRPGEMIPCDAVVESGEAAVDVSRVTGEPLPLAAAHQVPLLSGSLVLDGPLTIRASDIAAHSLYAQIVELVRSAQASKAPFQRMADRAAIWFTPFTLLVCALAWLVSGEAARVLAVLVVATPCPLILAAPVAFVGGINRAARRGIVVRHGGAIEALARIDTVVFDKTGTVTVGYPTVSSVQAEPPWSDAEVLAHAAAVEESAGHALARSIVAAARTRGATPLYAQGVREAPGRGVTGRVQGAEVVVGSRSLVAESAPEAAAILAGRPRDRDDLHAFVAIGGRPAGIIGFADRPRAGIGETMAGLERLGIARVALLSGDHGPTAEAVGRALGFREAVGDLLPGDKVRWVERVRSEGRRVLMVGDGINDAPALSAASVGMAVARHGGGIAAEAADVVLLADDPRRVPEAIALGRRTLGIARLSVGIGLGLSGIGMLVAAWGYLPPVAGALAQEAIDLAVILNALRAAPFGSSRASR